MDKTLVIMAAGMGSRYGGNKQIDGMGPNNEVLMLYSIYDAINAGFTKVVFIIKRAFEERFREAVGDVVKDKIKVEYAFQELSDLPEGTVPAERVKPLGTVHAILSAKDLIHEPFAVLNADDYYGTSAFKTMSDHLEKLRPEANGCMVGYYLKNTVSENGHVTRGVCAVDAEGCLESVTETYKIQPFPDGTIRDVHQDEAGVILDPDAQVSMNFWGLTPWFFRAAERDLIAFLQDESGDPMKKECVLPVEIDRLMHSDGLKVKVLHTDAVWFGVTYLADKEYVAGELRKLHGQGAYPALV